MFVFITSVLFNFKFSLAENEPPPKLEPQQGLVLSPTPYKLVITELNSQ